MENLTDIISNGKSGDIQQALSSEIGKNFTEQDLIEAMLHASLEGIIWAVKELLAAGVQVDCRDNSLWTPLMRASNFGYFEVAELLLDAGADVNTVNDSGRTALTLSALQGRNSIEIIRLLVSRGADLNAGTEQNISALGEACWNGRPETVKLLVKLGADTNVCNRSGRSVKAWAAASGHPGLLELIFDKSAQEKVDAESLGQLLLEAAKGDDPGAVKSCLDKDANIHARDAQAYTALMYAARKSLKVVKMLLQHGARLESRSKSGDSAITLAAGSHNPHIVKFLLARGAKAQPPKEFGISALRNAVTNGSLPVTKVLLESRDTVVDYLCHNGNTALMIAAGCGKPEPAALLLEHGADISLADSDGNQPLHHAALRGSTKIIELFIKHGAVLDALNKLQATPLALAAREGKKDAAIKLIELGSDINSADRNSGTVLIKAVEGRKTALVKKLLDQGADPAVISEHGDSAIRSAMEAGRLHDELERNGRPKNRRQDKLAEIVDLLLEAGADPNSPADFNSLLGAAVVYRCPEVAAALIDHGADINLPGDNGLAPLIVAVEVGNLEAVKLLVKHGADLSKVNAQGENLLDLATRRHQDKIFRYLKARWNK
jgi:hypothetical protein